MSSDDSHDAAARAEALRAQIEGSPTRSLAEHRRASRRSFLVGGIGALAGFAGFRHVQGRPEQGNVPDVLRQGHEFNEALWSRISTGRRAPTYPDDRREDLRINGRIGLRSEIDLAAWRLSVEDPSGAKIDEMTLDDVRSLGEESIVWEHKCIEGWSQIVGWTGARFADLSARYGLDYANVSLATPDGAYYVGLDRAAAEHPQTLLAWAMNDDPLTELHGAPLRLATPVKYGIKQLKRIGTIRFTDERPADYWAERGYSWYAGL